jgi:hypothetical protein
MAGVDGRGEAGGMDLVAEFGRTSNERATAKAAAHRCLTRGLGCRLLRRTFGISTRGPVRAPSSRSTPSTPTSAREGACEILQIHARDSPLAEAKRFRRAEAALATASAPRLRMVVQIRCSRLR